MAELKIVVDDNGDIHTEVDGVRDSSCSNFANFLRRVMNAKIERRKKTNFDPRNVHTVSRVSN